MQYSRLLALFALLATTAVAMPRAQRGGVGGEPQESSDNPTDIPNPAEAGHTAGDATSDETSTQSPDGLVQTAVDCKVEDKGTYTGADIQTLLAGWGRYSASAANSGGPYLSGDSSTVFHTDEYDWSEYSTHKGDVDGHKYCDACMTGGINAGAKSITCNIEPGGFFVASFTDKMRLGKKA